MKFKNKTYDALKFIAQIGLPAFGTLYVTLAGVWGLPSAEEVVSTVVAVDTFLGVVLQISSANHKSSTVAQGTLEVIEHEEGRTYTLELDGDPDYELEGKDQVVFRVTKRKGTPLKKRKFGQ